MLLTYKQPNRATVCLTGSMQGLWQLAFFKSALPQGKVHSRRCIDTNICLASVSPAVILPTIWRYLQTLEAAPYFLGLALSAFSFSGLLSGPLFGHWSDRTGTSKKIILFANCFEIIGESAQISYPNNFTYVTFPCQKHTLLSCFIWIILVHWIFLLLAPLQVISCTLWASPNGSYCRADWWQVSLHRVRLRLTIIHLATDT